MAGDEFDVAIVGAGVVGAPLAAAMAKLGHRVALIERDWNEPDRIVGELLQPGGVQALVDLGLHDPTSAVDDPIDVLRGIEATEENGYAVVHCEKKEKVVLSYPKTADYYVDNVNSHRVPKSSARRDLGDCFADGRPRGWSFHFGRFVMRLRNVARSTAGVKCIDGTAKDMIEDDVGVCGITYKDSHDELHEVKAALTVIADGCFSNFRRKVGVVKPRVVSHFVGLILDDVDLPVPNHGNVFLSKTGPILAYQIGPTEQRVLVDVPDPLPSVNDGSLKRHLLEVVAPSLKGVAPELYDAFVRAVETKKLRSMPNGQLHADPQVQRPGLFILGDAYNMRHPLTGGGMTVALNDVLNMRNLLAQQDKSQLHDRIATVVSLGPFDDRRRNYSGAVNILANALYKVFTVDMLLDACYAYFKLGGNCASSPMALLAGIAQQPGLLVRHFFMVAFYGVYRQLRWIPTPWKVLRAITLINTASWIAIPLMTRENIFRKFATFLSYVFFWRPRASLEDPSAAGYN